MSKNHNFMTFMRIEQGSKVRYPVLR